MNNELLLNKKYVPTEDSLEYDSFWNEERNKAMYGVTIHGIYIPGWLYWHTQLWNIYINEKDSLSNTVIRKSSNPKFRDNEWIIAEAIKEAEDNHKGVMIFGARRFGKSEIIASYLSQGAILYKGTENVIMGGNWGDLDVTMAKVIHGLNELPSYFQSGRIKEDLRKEIELGHKDKKGKRYAWSKIICRNHENGVKTESPAGLTPSRFVMEEIGKSKFAEVFEAAKPAFTSEYGWRCSPVLIGTSGDIESSSDAQTFFENPEAHNFITRILPEEGNKKTSVFISGMYRMDGKVDKTFGNFVENEIGLLLPKDSELFLVPMSVKDDVKALGIIEQERAAAEKSPDPTALLKAKMYFPLNTTELFLTDDGNNFPKEVIQDTIAYLEANPDLQGTPCELYRDADNKVQIKWNTTKRPILDFPMDRSKFLAYKKDAPIIIYEEPKEIDLDFLYIAGLDSYNVSSSKWSDSLGSLFIYKRYYNPVDGTFQRRIVAEYTARPNDINIWHENIIMLLELYNATCMMENEATSTITYFDLKNKANLLADGFSLLKEIHPTTSITNRTKGLPATPRVQSHYKEDVYKYLTEEIIVGYNKDHTPIKKLGVIRIPSIGLLKELLFYNDKGNFDRYVSFGHVLTYEKWMDKMYSIVDTSDYTKDNDLSVKNTRSPFGSGLKSPFGKPFSNPFQ